ncbi:MAG: cell division inhibitor MinD [Firmicutes bacterium ADurb.Bin419]|nr:MAG: cell division inhibitor MinD [Firmicutes bacterium ADurb.Bin419]
MNILIIGDGEHSKLIKYVFPSAYFDTIDTDEAIPGGEYELVFISYSEVWEETAKNLSTNSKKVLMTPSDLDITVSILDAIQKYSIDTITSFDNLETQLKILSKRYSKRGVTTKLPLSKNVITTRSSEPSTQAIDETEIYISKFKSLIIAITGSKGGTGKSAVSINLAAALAQKNNLKVGLIDFDLKNNSCVANRLDLDFSRTIKVFADKINVEKMQNIFVGHPAGFYILPGLEHIGESNLITLGVVDKIIKHAASSLDIVILDLSATLDTTTIRSLELANVRYVVTDCSKDAFRRMETILSTPEVFDGAKLIVNKVPKTFKNVLLDAQISNLHKKHQIPVIAKIRTDDNETVSWAEQKIPILNAKCKTLKEDFHGIINDIEEHIVDKAPKIRNKGQKSGLFGVLKRG